MLTHTTNIGRSQHDLAGGARPERPRQLESKQSEGAAPLNGLIM